MSPFPRYCFIQLGENTMSEKENTFKTLFDINVSDKIKSKIGLSYLSWAYAWGELKKAYPDAFWTVYSREITSTTTKTIKEQDGTEIVTVTEESNEVPYFTDGKTCYVKVGVTINDHEEVEMLPVMDNRNNAVPLATITMTAVNKAIQRAFVKACARHGLGLYVYAGEDLPEVDKKVIDFKAIAENCDRFETKALSQEGFDKMKNDVIALFTIVESNSNEFPEEARVAIRNYTIKQTAGKRLSLFELESDNQKLQRIYNFINEVKKQLAAPSGR